MITTLSSTMFTTLSRTMFTSLILATPYRLGLDVLSHGVYAITVLAEFTSWWGSVLQSGEQFVILRPCLMPLAESIWTMLPVCRVVWCVCHWWQLEEHPQVMEA